MSVDIGLVWTRVKKIAIVLVCKRVGNGSHMFGLHKNKKEDVGFVYTKDKKYTGRANRWPFWTNYSSAR